METRDIKKRVKEEGWIHIRMIQEVAGFPKEKVETFMDQLNGQLVALSGVEVLEREIHEAKLVDEKEGIWSMYAELELLVDSFSKVLLIIFDFMPSSIEILAPEKISDNSGELAGALNDLIGKLHQLDSSVKKLFAQNKFLVSKLKDAVGKKKSKK